MEEYDAMDILSETQVLSDQERTRLSFILKDLNSYWIIEETKARQRSRDRIFYKGIGTLLTFMQWLIKGEGRR
jgi:hypothetical protein